MYTFLVTMTFGLTLFTAIWVIFYFVFLIKNDFNDLRAKDALFRLFNRLSDKKIILNVFRIYSILSLICWFILALPFFDFILSIDVISTYDYTSDIFTTFFGNFVGKDQNKYFAVICIGTIGVKGFFVIHEMAKILSKNYLAVSPGGQWGDGDNFY